MITFIYDKLRITKTLKLLEKAMRMHGYAWLIKKQLSDLSCYSCYFFNRREPHLLGRPVHLCTLFIHPARCRLCLFSVFIFSCMTVLSRTLMYLKLLKLKLYAIILTENLLVRQINSITARSKAVVDYRHRIVSHKIMIFTK